MTREEFQRLCRERIVFLDGATGTNLQKAGMPTGVCPEAWILEHPDTMMQLQKAYFEAGSDIVLAPTFTANRIKLDEYGLVDKIEEMMDAIEGEIFNTEEKEISSTRIGEIVMEHLKDLDAVAYVRFASVYREFKDVSTFMDELKKFLN